MYLEGTGSVVFDHRNRFVSSCFNIQWGPQNRGFKKNYNCRKRFVIYNLNQAGITLTEGSSIYPWL